MSLSNESEVLSDVFEGEAMYISDYQFVNLTNKYLVLLNKWYIKKTLSSSIIGESNVTVTNVFNSRNFNKVTIIGQCCK